MNELPNIACSLILVSAIPFLRRAFFYRPTWRLEDKKTSGRIQLFDILRGLAILAVVGIHAVDFYRLELGTKNLGLFFVNALLRFAIPLFLIASGSLLDPHDLQQGNSKRSFYRRKVVRILVPYVALTVFWSLIKPDFSLSALSLHLLRGDILRPYYFVIVLFELYLLYPLLVRFAAHRWFLPASLGISLCAMALGFRYISGVPLPFEHLFYFAYGIALRPFLLAPRQENKKPLVPWLWIAAFYFIGFFAVPYYYYNAVYFWGVAVFWILYLLQPRIPEIPKKGLAYMGRLSLWIFLLHYPILLWAGKHEASILQWLPTGIGVLLLSGSTLVLTLPLAALIQRVTQAARKATPVPR